MKKLTEYIIPFSGMKIGSYTYEFKIGKEFFDAFEYSEIKEGDVTVQVGLEKSETMMLFDFSITGTLDLECDKCLEPLSQPVSREFRQIFKFTDAEDLFLDDEIRNIPFSQFEVDLSPYIVEFINLCKPIKVVHPEGECNVDVSRLLDEYLLVEDKENEISENEEVDPRWEALRKLKKNN